MAERVIRCRPLLGTFVEVTSDSVHAVDAAFAAVERVHHLMSAHDSESELSKINRFGHVRPITIDLWTARVLRRACHWARLSNGAFDPVVAGGKALERGLLPFHPGIQDACNADWKAVVLDDCQVSLRGPACIDLGGIAKGFAVDRAIAALRAAGAAYGLVNAGGDLAGFGPEPWHVQIVDPGTRAPMMVVEIRNQALATSALQPGSGGHLLADHLVGADPLWAATTVLAASAMDADALTKIVLAGRFEAADCLASVEAHAVTIDRMGDVRELPSTIAVREAA